MKKILITGGAGFIGHNLIKYLIKNHKFEYIFSLDDYSSGLKSNHQKHKNIRYIEGSTIDIFKKRTLSKIKFDTVFHFAEFSRIVPSFKYSDDCWNTNIVGTYKIIQFCLKKKARLVYSASSSTIGKNKYLSPYSWTKYVNDETIKNYSKWFGLKYNLVYFYNVYGTGHIKNGKMMAVIGIFEQQYVKRIPLTVVKPGTQKRDFTHIDDIITGTILATKKTINSEFHIGSGKNYTLLQVAKFFNTEIKMIDERQGERFYSLSDSKLAFKKLGYKPKNNLKDYIKEFIKKN